MASQKATRRLQAVLIPLACAYLGYKMLKVTFTGIAPVGFVVLLGIGILIAIYLYPSKEQDARRHARRKLNKRRVP